MVPGHKKGADMATALITGASSGIGMELARVHAERGGDVVLVARRRELLEKLKSEIEAQFNIKAIFIVIDLSEQDAGQRLYEQVKQTGIHVDYLINNAGFGDWGPFYHQDADKCKAMLNVNILALTMLTRLFLADMVAANTGKILNVASVAGFMPGPYHAVYFASKAYVISLSRAIADELRNTNVTVTALCPGATDTEFALRANSQRTRLFKGHLASARDVAIYGYDAMLRGKTVAVHGLGNKLLTSLLLRIVPASAVVKGARKTMEP